MVLVVVGVEVVLAVMVVVVVVVVVLKSWVRETSHYRELVLEHMQPITLPQPRPGGMGETL